MRLQIYVYTLIIDDEKDEDEMVKMGETIVGLFNPSQKQCMEVICQMKDSQHDVVLVRLTRDCIDMLLPYIMARKGITGIFMRDTPMHGIVHLISSQMSILKSLALVACSIDDDDVIPLAQALKHNTSLFELCLSSNPGITSNSAYAFAEILLTNNSLGSLMLGETNVCHSGISALFESLLKNKKVWKLEISEQHENSCKLIPSYLFIMHRIEFV